MSRDEAFPQPVEEPEPDQSEIKDRQDEPDLEALERHGVPELKLLEIEEPEDEEEAELEALERQEVPELRLLEIEEPEDNSEGRTSGYS
jgi:hypothetical protein